MTVIGAPPARSRLTTLLVEYLTAELDTARTGNDKILVGRGQAPKPGGWPNQPGQGLFKPYVVIKAAAARPGPSPETVGRPRSAWQMGYTLTMSGQLEGAVDDTADQVRDTLVQMEGPFDLRGTTWSLLTVSYSALGATAPNNSTNPPFWEVSDAVSLWLFRDRGQ